MPIKKLTNQGLKSNEVKYLQERLELMNMIMESMHMNKVDRPNEGTERSLQDYEKIVDANQDVVSEMLELIFDIFGYNAFDDWISNNLQACGCGNENCDAYVDWQ
jgi:hypothetical protein